MTAYVYARGAGATAAMAFGPDGRLYVATQGGTIEVVGTPGAAPQTLVSGLPIALGLAWRGSELVVSVRGSVRSYQLSNGGLTGGRVVVGGLPTGRHQNDAILPMPNGDVLLGVGSTCDVCTEPNPRSATVLRFRADWTFAVVITFKDVAAFVGPSADEEIQRRLYPDRAKFLKEEQRRFEILDAHWDVPLNELDLK